MEIWPMTTLVPSLDGATLTFVVVPQFLQPRTSAAALQARALGPWRGDGGNLETSEWTCGNRVRMDGHGSAKDLLRQTGSTAENDGTNGDGPACHQRAPA